MSELAKTIRGALDQQKKNGNWEMAETQCNKGFSFGFPAWSSNGKEGGRWSWIEF
jgi:hypothetical protein